MNKQYIAKVGISVVAATMLIGLLFTMGTDGKSDDVLSKDVDYKAYANVEDSMAGETVENDAAIDLSDIEKVGAVAGMALNITDYYEAVYSGDVSDSLVLELDAYTSEETAKKLEAFEEYENLGITTVDTYLNVRKKPSKNGDIIGKMVGNSACEILEYEDGWYYIQSGPVKGYVSADYIVTGDEAKRIAIEEATLRAVVSTSVLNVRKEPSTDSKVVEKVGNKERYSVLEVLDGWIKISIDGEEGYVSDEFVEVKYALLEAIEFTPVDPKSAFRSSIVDYALQFLGNPYVWGGTSLTRGADCSGFTLSVYKHFGITLSHSSRAQANEGRAISGSELRPGDLVFYGGGRINHVAIYIGNGKIVHASDENTGIIISRYNNRTPVKYVNVIGD